MLGAVLSEAVVFGFVTSESKLVVLRVKGVEGVCLPSDMSAVVFFISCGVVV